MYITLRCKHCDNTDCPIARAYIPEDSLEGCTRRVSEEDSEKFQYYIEEVIPLSHSFSRLEEARVFLDRMYHMPFGRKLDAKGKVDPSSTH